MNKEKIKALLILVLLVSLVWFFFFNKSNNDEVIADISPKSATASELKVIAFGDSLTAGYGLLLSEAYPAQLESNLQAEGYDVSVINSGVSGETTRGNLERADFIASQKAEVVILGIGGNDALRLLPITETRGNIEKTIETLMGSGSVVVLLQMQAPLTAGLGYKREFDSMYEEIAAEKGVILVPFLTAELFLSAENKLPDGIHYNKEGYRKAVLQYIAPVVKDILDKLKN